MGGEKKRGAEEGARGPPPKRPTPAPSLTPDELRAELAGVFACYEALFRAAGSKGEGREEDYEGLLRAAEGERRSLPLPPP